YVDLDFYDDVSPASIKSEGGYLVLPTLPAPFEQIAQRVNNILKKVEKMPLEEISQDLRTAIN
ncbi:MAG: MCE family protein, partial [Gammaproteobacteria bacterium]|nr:MCE family protein [Gammaproteobacteria bacterium]